MLPSYGRTRRFLDVGYHPTSENELRLNRRCSDRQSALSLSRGWLARVEGLSNPVAHTDSAARIMRETRRPSGRCVWQALASFAAHLHDSPLSLAHLAIPAGAGQNRSQGLIFCDRQMPRDSHYRIRLNSGEYPNVCSALGKTAPWWIDLSEFRISYFCRLIESPNCTTATPYFLHTLRHKADGMRDARRAHVQPRYATGAKEEKARWRPWKAWLQVEAPRTDSLFREGCDCRHRRAAVDFCGRRYRI